MVRSSLVIALASALCLTVSFTHAQPRGKGAEKPKGGEERKGGESPKAGEKPKTGEKPASEGRAPGKAPGGAWSEGKSPAAKEGRNEGPEGKNKSPATGKEGAAAGAAAANKNNPSASGKEGAAAGAAAANRNNPAASGKEGAAAGAAAANRNNPTASGKEGAAAGAAAANRNKPAASGAEGAAAGAAAANRNKPAASGAEGAAAGAALANRNQPNASGAAGAAAGYAAVRNSFDHPHLYNQQWYADHRGAWSAANWSAGAAWTLTGLAAVSSHYGYAGTPVSYGYGDNVTYQNGNVIVDGRNVGTGEEFSQQAADLALFGQNAKTSATDEWLPLGVFALVRNVDQQPQTTVQLAINQQGILRGNYTDLVSDHALPLEGAVDKETQRAAWTVGENKNFFMEAGLKNLTDGEAPALIHKYSKTERWLLVSLPQPEQTTNAAP